MSIMKKRGWGQYGDLTGDRYFCTTGLVSSSTHGWGRGIPLHFASTGKEFSWVLAYQTHPGNRLRCARQA